MEKRAWTDARSPRGRVKFYPAFIHTKDRELNRSKVVGGSVRAEMLHFQRIIHQERQRGIYEIRDGGASRRYRRCTGYDRPSKEIWRAIMNSADRTRDRNQQRA